jgi:N-acetylneuraminic acid mutarotase
MESIGHGETDWRPEPDLPPGPGPLVGTALDDKLYIEVPHTGLAIYDPKTRAWSMVPHLPIGRSSEMAAYHGEIWIMGGRDMPSGWPTYIFNPRTAAWSEGPTLPEQLNWGAAGSLGDTLILTGGAGAGYYSDRTYMLQKRK